MFLTYFDPFTFIDLCCKSVKKKYCGKKKNYIRYGSEIRKGCIRDSTSMETNNTDKAEVMLSFEGKYKKWGNYYDVFANNQRMIYYLESGKIYVDAFPL